MNRIAVCVGSGNGRLARDVSVTSGCGGRVLQGIGGTVAVQHVASDRAVIGKVYTIRRYSSSHKGSVAIVIYRVIERVIYGENLVPCTDEAMMSRSGYIVYRCGKVGDHTVVDAVVLIIYAEHGISHACGQLVERSVRTVGHSLHNGISSRSVAERAVRQVIFARFVVLYDVYAFVNAVTFYIAVIRIARKTVSCVEIYIAGVEIYVVVFSDAGHVGVAGQRHHSHSRIVRRYHILHLHHPDAVAVACRAHMLGEIQI